MKRLIFLLTLIAAWSCSSDNASSNAILNQVQMQAVMMDLILSEALNYEKSIKDSSFHLEIENVKSAAWILKKHQISDSMYKQSCAYYASRPDLLQVITDSVAAVCNRMSIAIYNDTLNNKLNGSNLKNPSR